MTKRTPPSAVSTQSGFTLVVIAALFVAFAVIAAVAVERNTTVQIITRRDATADQLTRLSNAIIQYSVFNRGSSGNLYPCPALPNLPATDINFGVSVMVSSVPNCADTASDSGGYTGTGLQILSGSNVIRGMVPVQTLSAYGVSINDAFDPWNDRIMYIVNRKLTINSPAGGQTDYASNPGVVNINGLAIDPPDFILISYGRDGIGGIKRTSTGIAIACGGAGIRYQNCDDDTSFTYLPTYTNVAQIYSAKYFDDILTFYRQAQ